MVYFSPRFFLSAIFLSTRVSFLVALSGKCCEGDSTCSGCWMCPGSNLRSCWDDAILDVNACSGDQDIATQVDCLCKAYGKIAFCWSQGKCCTEYAPTLAAATNLCNLKTHPPDSLTQEIVDKVKNDASYVTDTIWHNDSGWHVPKLAVYVEVYSSSYSESSYSTQSSHHDTSTPTHYQGKSAEYLEKEKSSPELESNNPSGEKQLQEYSPSQVHKQEYQYKIPSPKGNNLHQQSQSYQHDHNTQSHTAKVYHKAKCSREKHKCQKQIASQYHKARRDQASKSLVKRAQSPLPRRFEPHPKNVELWKRSERTNESGARECGVDFLGVTYPSHVPKSVSSVFDTL